MEKALQRALFLIMFGGSGEIRTHGGRKPSPVFKTGALNHSATLPARAQLYSIGQEHLLQIIQETLTQQSGRDAKMVSKQKTFGLRCIQGRIQQVE